MKCILTLCIWLCGMGLSAQSLFDFRNELLEKPIPLNGFWEFNYGELLFGSDSSEYAPLMVKVPHDWA